ncbi:hypothetical protein E1287_41900, partial [Actinomadura sp. KC06]
MLLGRRGVGAHDAFVLESGAGSAGRGRTTRPRRECRRWYVTGHERRSGEIRTFRVDRVCPADAPNDRRPGRTDRGIGGELGEADRNCAP